MRIVFAGTPELSAVQLAALLKTPHEICAVYTQPDRPAGRGKHLMASPVKTLALAAGLPVYQPKTLRTEEAQAVLKSLHADLLVVVAYGLILPQAVLDLPRLGCVNLHFSLLPRLRGAAPIQRAILAGDTVTGVTLMQMDQGLDTGNILYQQACDILPHDTSETLSLRLSDIGVEILQKILPTLKTLSPKTQDETQASYAHKILKEEGRIDWQKSAVYIERQIRAFSPWPIAFTERGEVTLRIWKARLSALESSKPPGTILSISKRGMEVATGEGVLCIEDLQLPGKKMMSIAAAVNGNLLKFNVGDVLE